MQSRNPLLAPKISTKLFKWSEVNLNPSCIATMGDSDKYLWCVAEKITGNSRNLPQAVVDGIAWGYRLQIIKPGYWKNKIILGKLLFSTAQRIVTRARNSQAENERTTLALCLFYLSETQWYLYDSGNCVAHLYRNGQFSRISSSNKGHTKQKLAVIGLSKLTMTPKPKYGVYKKGDIFVLQSQQLLHVLDLHELGFLLQKPIDDRQFDLAHKALLDKYSIKIKQIESLYSVIISVS